MQISAFKYGLQVLLFLSASFIPVAANAQSLAFVEVSGGREMICATTATGELDCRFSAATQRIAPPQNLPPLFDIEVGSVHGCGLTAAGNATCWGDNDFGQLDAPESTIFQSLSSGEFHNCGILTDGSVECWGLNNKGQSNPAVDTSGGESIEDFQFIELDLSEEVSCGLDTSGNVRCWGDGAQTFRPQSTAEDADDNEEVISFAIAKRFSFARSCGLLNDGTIDCLASNYQFDGLYTDIAGFSDFMCALDLEGYVECQASFGDRSLSEFISDQVNSFNSGEPLVSISGNSRLCGVTASGMTRCISPYEGAFFPVTTPSDALIRPAAPENLRASIYSDSTIELQWNGSQNSAFEIDFAEIYRDEELFAQTSQFSSYLDDTLEPGRQYEYKVRYVSPTGINSDFSSTIIVNTLGGTSPGQPPSSAYTPIPRPLEPGNLQSLVYGSDLLELQWDRVSSATVGYEIRRDNVFVGYTAGVSYVDSTVESGGDYAYEVIAVRDNGEILGVSLVRVSVP